MLDKQSEKFDRKLDATLETKLGEEADNISKVREELRDGINMVEQELRAEVKEVRSETFTHMTRMAHGMAHMTSEVERLEDMIKQLSADGGQSAAARSTQPPVPGTSNGAVVAAFQADLQASDTRSTIRNLCDASDSARKKFLSDVKKTNDIKHGPNIKRNAELNL